MPSVPPPAQARGHKIHGAPGSIDELAELIIAISGKTDIGIRHVEGPQGVRGRNSDNSLLREVLGWEPPTRLEEGLVPTCRWIEKQVQESGDADRA